MEAVIANVAMAEVYDVNLEMIPLTAADGSLVADVTFYGAIGGDCEHPDIAYDFLRQLLTEDLQWEKNTKVHNDPILYTYSTEDDIHALADQWLQALQWHLYEG